jgi:glutaredoxin
MKNLKKYWPLGLAIVIILALGVLIFKQEGSKMILFYGDGCPHCKIVDEYIEANNVTERFKFRKMEVFNNRGNAALMNKYAKECGLDTSQGMGVPFFFDGGQCFIGDQDVINYFQTAPVATEQK